MHPCRRQSMKEESVNYQLSYLYRAEPENSSRAIQRVWPEPLYGSGCGHLFPTSSRTWRNFSLRGCILFPAPRRRRLVVVEVEISLLSLLLNHEVNLYKDLDTCLRTTEASCKTSLTTGPDKVRIIFIKWWWCWCAKLLSGTHRLCYPVWNKPI